MLFLLPKPQIQNGYQKARSDENLSTMINPLKPSQIAIQVQGILHTSEQSIFSYPSKAMPQAGGPQVGPSLRYVLKATSPSSTDQLFPHSSVLRESHNFDRQQANFINSLGLSEVSGIYNKR